jgi:hypothetical protein
MTVASGKYWRLYGGTATRKIVFYALRAHKIDGFVTDCYAGGNFVAQYDKQAKDV